MMYVAMRHTHKRFAQAASLLVIAGILLLSIPGGRANAINTQIHFQGKLANPDGTNVTNGSYSILFTIYDGGTETSGGTNVWSETQSVTVADGIFTVRLGSVNTNLGTAVDFTHSPLYLSVKVGSDAEMTPRIFFTSAPYAFNAAKADNATQLGGIASSGYVQLSPSGQQTGNINISGNATVGGTYNGNTFTGASLQFSSAATSSIQGASSQAFNVDSGTSGSLALGASNATGVTLGKFGTTTTTAGIFTVNSGTNIPTADQVVIDNTSSTGVTTAGVNGLNVKYKGGAAAVEAAGLRVDFTPGTTSGGTWSGMRIVETVAAASGVSSYGLKLEGAGSGAGTSYGIGVATGWDIGVDIQSGGIQLASQNDPATPAAGNLRIYAKDIAGRVMPKWIGPSGVDTPMQANLGFNRVSMIMPAGGTTGTTFIGGYGSTFTNVANAYANPTPATTNLLTSTRRATFTSSAVAGNIVSHRQSTLQVWRGNAANLGGYFYTIRFATSTLQNGNRAFVGLSASTAAPTNIDPLTSGTISRIGVAINANTGNWYFVTNATGVAPTTTDLGATMPVSATNLYELILFSPPNGSSVGYRLKNLSTGDEVAGSAAANLPTNTTFMAPQFWMTNNATAAAVVFNFGGWYLESDQ